MTTTASFVLRTLALIAKRESVTLTERTNDQWIQALSQLGPQREKSLADLRAFLLRGLRHSLSSRSGVDDALIEDFAQDAILKILDGLDTFRGESRFTTWAQTIAVRVAFTELRRRRWKDASLDQRMKSAEFDPESRVDPAVGPDKQAAQEAILKIMHRIIHEKLTERQRQAIVAEIQNGTALEEVARRMGTNRNALYKLLHDARQKLRKGLLDARLTLEQIRSAFDL